MWIITANKWLWTQLHMHISDVCGLPVDTWNTSFIFPLVSTPAVVRNISKMSAESSNEITHNRRNYINWPSIGGESCSQSLIMCINFCRTTTKENTNHTLSRTSKSLERSIWGNIRNLRMLAILKKWDFFKDMMDKLQIN